MQPAQEVPNRKKRLFKADSLLGQWQLQSMIIPGVVFMIIFNLIPIWGLVIAFKNYTVTDTMASAPWVGLDNFKEIIGDQMFWQSVVNTLAISFLKLLIGFVLPIIIAVMIFELKDGPFKRIVQTISYMPHFLSWIVLGGMLISWLSTTGLLNQVGEMLGLIHHAQNQLIEPSKYWWIATLSDVWQNAGWGTILYLATMSKIDPTYYEAAQIDGASRMRQIWSITLPGISEMIGLNMILTISGLLNSNLDQTLVLMNTQNTAKAEVINSYVYRIGLTQGNFSYATAVGLGISVISVVLLVFTNKVAVKLNDDRQIL